MITWYFTFNRLLVSLVICVCASVDTYSTI
nr:MAG TPA: hypothetical protein [Caudoviricetes sp.]